MLWSLIKIVAFVAILIAATFGSTMVFDIEGSATIEVGGQVATFSFIQMVIALIVLVGLVLLAGKLVGLAGAASKVLKGDKTAIRRYLSPDREHKGIQALSEGVIALVTGDGRVAMAKIGRADNLLRHLVVTKLLMAQAAEATGDRKMAQATYKKLLKNPKTRLAAVRGIMNQHLADGDLDAALLQAEMAFAIKPKDVQTQAVLLRLQVATSDWDGARETLTAQLETGHLSRDVYETRAAVLALSEAKGLLAKGRTPKAYEAAIAANQMSPALVPAAVMVAEAYIAKNDILAAKRVVEKAWLVAPHPDLATVFSKIVPDESAIARMKRFSVLTGVNADHPETKMLLAELNIAAEVFPDARRAISALVDEDPSVRSLKLMAAIERGEGSPESVVHKWLEKALTAPHGPHWVCDKCQHIHPSWGPICKNCSEFDTITWRAVMTDDDAMLGDVETVLPVIDQTAAAAPIVEDKK